MSVKPPTRKEIVMFVNRNELKAQLVRNNMTASDLAKILGISRQSLSLRMTSKSDFTEKELKIMKDKFGEVIFF